MRFVCANVIAQARNLVVSHKMTVGALLALHSEDAIFTAKAHCKMDISVQAISVARAWGGRRRAQHLPIPKHLRIHSRGLMRARDDI